MTSPRTIGPYVVDREIGRGGMGVVWLAQDPRLGRSVAIKMLPPELGGDPERLARLAREAKMLAALSHPNVAGIHGLEEAEGTTCLVLEFVDGETLADRIARGPLPVDDALAVCAQIAAGLEAAHEAGVIHRDLKPSNVKITPAGVVKVLDFGLAKGGVPSDGSSAGLTNSPTLSALATQAGIILGTAAYMSPEQARGRAVDRRTDVWAFGCVLYECLTGAHAFEGETVSDTLAAILRGEPDWGKLPAETPPVIRRLLRRALEKDPKKRLRDVGDARVEIEEALAGGPGSEAWGSVGPSGGAGGAGWGASSGAGSQSGSATGSVGGAGRRADSDRAGGRARFPIPIAPLSIICSTLFLLVLVLMNRGGGDGTKDTAGTRGAAGALASATEPTCVSIVLPESLKLDLGAGPSFDLTPDGRQLAYIEAGSDFWRVAIRSLDSFDAHGVSGAEWVDRVACSADGRWLALGTGGEIRKISASGGSPTRLCEALSAAPGLCWGPDDRIFFVKSWAGGLWSVPAAGGEPTAVTQLDSTRGDVSHRWPQALPDGRHVLFTIKTATMTSFDDAPIALADLKTGQIKILLEGGSYGRIAAGHLIYARAGKLYAAPFDENRLELSGPARPILEGVMMTPIDGGAMYAVSLDGTIVYVTGPAWLRLRHLCWVSRDGKETPIPTDPTSLLSPRLSPDGRRIVLRVSAPNDKVWLYDLERGTLDRLTSGPGNENGPIWSEDGSRVFFTSDFTGEGDILSMRAESGAPYDTIVAGPAREYPMATSPDGRELVFQREEEKTGSDLWAISLGPDRTERAIAVSQFHEFDAAFSPDGHWIAYSSTESGRPEVYVQPYPGPGGKTRVSTGGGWGTEWPKRGTELFYRTDDSMMVVPIATSPSVRIGTPRALSGLGKLQGRYEPSFDVSPDGSRLLLMKIPPEQPSETNRVNVVSGWWTAKDRR